MKVGLKKERRNEHDPQNPLSKLKTPFMYVRVRVCLLKTLYNYLPITLGTFLD
jgi:hypothetical protein